MQTILTSRPAAKILAAVTTAQIFPDFAIPTQACVMNVPGTGRLEQKSFTVRASGNASTNNATTTFKPTLYIAKALPGTSLVAASWTVLCTGTARVINNTTAPWWIEAVLEFDSKGGLMGGVFDQQVNNLYDGIAAITGTLTGLNGTGMPVLQGATNVQPADPVFLVAVGGTYGVNAAAANIANLQNFVLEA